MCNSNRNLSGNQHTTMESSTLLDHVEASPQSIHLEKMAKYGESPITPEMWVLPALACALAYAMYNIAIKKASDDINPILGGVILQFVAAIAGLCVFLGEREMKTDDEAIFANPEGIMWSIAAGLFVGAAEIISFVVNGKGVPATQSIPVIIGGSVLFGTVLGRIFLAEIVSCRGWFGVFLITVGVAIVSMEPGMASH